MKLVNDPCALQGLIKSGRGTILEDEIVLARVHRESHACGEALVPTQNGHLR